MGRRDFRHREPKKQKRDTRKVSPVSIIVPPPTTVEVVKKVKKGREEAEEEV
ncbi:MAG TPA: hypothetical protein VMW00_00945 [Dehalococcoidales bacterium]|nr:hypothetical protein [Dehalococcoidales bacterium]